jgi:hypothetical protein
MESERFDRLAIALGRRIPRRSVLGLLSALGLAGLVTLDAVAQLGGLVDGQPCISGNQCSSGFCKRKRGTNTMFCRHAPGQGICIRDEDQCTAGSSNCNAANSDPCVCYVTRLGYSFCGSVGVECFACESSTNCEKRRGGRAGDRCIECASSCSTTNGRACVRTCPKRASA